MKYMILLYSNPTNWKHPLFLQQSGLTPDERDDRLSEFDALMEEMSQSGEIVGGQVLADPLLTKTVRVREGVLTATDGPFADTKEHMAGYFIVDCESIERAVEIASRIPDVRDSVAEVKPIMELSGSEM